MSETASGTSSNLPSEITFGRLSPSPFIIDAGMHGCRNARSAFPRPWLARTRRARGLNPPDRIAAAEIEVDLGQAGLQLILAAHIFHLDSHLLPTERQQVDFSDRADRREPVTHLHPLAETG